MRERLLDLLYKEMEADPSIYFLTADMGINLVERFEESFPERFLNVGIAEQNMIGIAAGLAESGMRPFAYTISNFLIHRCFEQIRNDVSLHKLPVTLLGTSTGFDNAPLGATHHMLDDWGLVSNLPSFKVFSPFSISTVEETWNELKVRRLPTYVRLPKGKGIDLDAFDDSALTSATAVLSYGSAAGFANAYAQTHKMRFFAINELGLSSFDYLDRHLGSFAEIIVIEDQFARCGMYAVLCQWKNERNLALSINSIAPEDFQMEVGIVINDFIPSQPRFKFN